MAERVGAIQYRRSRRAESREDPAPGEQIANECFAAGNQLVGKHVPRSRLETLVGEKRGESRSALGPNDEIILEDNRLSVEEETLSGTRRIVDQLIDQRDEALSKELDRMIPLTVPMGVRNDMGVEHGEPAKSNERQRNALNLNESAVSIQPDALFPG
jgi:hypothetical protein